MTVKTPEQLARAQKKADKALDAKIEAIYYRRCSGIQISIMDMPKVYAAGRKAAKEDDDIEVAVVAFVETIRKN